MFAAGALAQSGVTPDQEYAKFVSRAKTVTPMTEFGDQVSLRDGGVVFRATDLEWKGIGPTIRITRSYKPTGVNQDLRDSSSNSFGGWELEVPRIKTIVNVTTGTPSTSPKGWQVSGSTAAYRDQRCTNFADPGRISFPANTDRKWEAYEWWDGYYVVDDTGNEQPLLSRADSTVNPSYKLMTLGNWLVGCLGTTANGQPGEGFTAVSTDGTKYTFNYLVYVPAEDITKYTTVPDALQRNHAAMLVTKVEDRFGNYLTYNYTGTHLTSIQATDGRRVDITFDSTNRISTVTAGSVEGHPRVWTYNYTPTQGYDALTVTRPDQSTWQYSLPVLRASDLNVGASVATCILSPNDYDNLISGTIKSPAGATLTIQFNRKRFGRSYVTKECWGGDQTWGGDSSNPENGYAMYPREWYGWVVQRRTITGPGLTPMNWVYSYAPPTSSWNQDCPNNSCPSEVWTDVTSPQGNRHRSIFSNKFNESENKLLREENYSPGQLLGSGDYSPGGQLLRTIVHEYATVAAGTTSPYPWPVQVGNDKRKRVNTLTQGRWAPERVTTITQDSVTFTRLLNPTDFDVYARPVNERRSNSLGLSRVDTTTYADFPAKWVMGQVATVTANGQAIVSNEYDAGNASLNKTSKFGAVQATYGYNTDGTMSSRADAAGHTTTFSSWYRGLPQTITYPTGAVDTAVVNENGWPDSITDAAGYVTAYRYDPMGRVKQMTPTGFTATDFTFLPVNGDEFGVSAGHWTQTATLGNAKTITYFDGLWRPVMTRVFDTAEEANTRKVVVKQYDADGRTTYESYPARDISAYNAQPGGVQTYYDGIGREIQKVASSELGPLTTTTAYLSGLQTQVTNPRGKVTTQSFWVLDDPSKAQLATIAAPLGVNVTISRDAFGKPTAITRGGSYGGFTSSVTRRYVYDVKQRLCMTVEPEVGATVQDYDTAGNVAWRAPGQAVADPANPPTCTAMSPPANSVMTYEYDALNRLKKVTYGDSSPGILRDYTPDGLLQNVSSNGSTWTYTYNALRRIATEKLSYGGTDYPFGWGYSQEGNINALSYPTGAVGYIINALGELKSINGYASNISYHPNGAVAGYTLDNHIVHTLTQNLRGLPLVNSDAGVMQDQYSYDENGNVASITDLQQGVFNRSMSYDDLDRLASANAPSVWGNATYSYDTVDNLRTAIVGTRVSGFNFNANNQLSNAVTNGVSTSYAFDANGNLISKGAQSFGFDLGNRLTGAGGTNNYAYDGLGRRTLVVSSDGSTRIQVYSQAGQLLWGTSIGGPRPTSKTAYVYLAGKQIAETETISGATQFVHTDALGSPVAHTTAPASGTGSLINQTRFEPYGYVVAGSKPSANTSVIGFTGHVQDAETDLVYMQQRYYDPIAGRFLSVDPVVTDANTGKQFARYTYVDNNPYLKTDPDGRDMVVNGPSSLNQELRANIFRFTGVPTKMKNGSLVQSGARNPSVGSAEAAKILQNAMASTTSITFNLVKNDPTVLLDQFTSNKFDVGDFGSASSARFGGALLSHVIAERMNNAEEKGGDNRVENHASAHAAGDAAELKVMGASSKESGGSSAQYVIKYKDDKGNLKSIGSIDLK